MNKKKYISTLKKIEFYKNRKPDNMDIEEYKEMMKRLSKEVKDFQDNIKK